MTGTLECRPGCAACCIAPSISSAIPGDPVTEAGPLSEGKAANMACPRLDGGLRCVLFGRAERPRVCASLRPEHGMCGSSREEALAYLVALEEETAPG